MAKTKRKAKPKAQHFRSVQLVRVGGPKGKAKRGVRRPRHKTKTIVVLDIKVDVLQEGEYRRNVIELKKPKVTVKSGKSKSVRRTNSSKKRTKSRTKSRSKSRSRKRPKTKPKSRSEKRAKSSSKSRSKKRLKRTSKRRSKKRSQRSPSISPKKSKRRSRSRPKRRPKSLKGRSKNF